MPLDHFRIQKEIHNKPYYKDKVQELNEDQKKSLYALWAMLLHTLSNWDHPKSVEVDKKIFRESYERASASLSDLFEKLEVVKQEKVEEKEGDGRIERKGRLMRGKEQVEKMHGNPLAEELWSQAGTGDMDGLMVRFLRARKWDARAAYEMLLTCLTWRQEVNVRGLIEDGEPAIRKHLFTSGESYFWKRDAAGRLAIFMRGRFHNRSAQNHDEMVAFTVFQIETGRRLMGSQEDNPGTVTLVFDLIDSTMASFDLGVIQFMAHALQSYYPECLGRALILNAPWIFSGFWKLIRPWLDPKVADKIVFVQGNMVEQGFFKAEDLQTEYGGLDPYRYSYATPEPLHRELPDQELLDDLRAAFDEAKAQFVEATFQQFYGENEESRRSDLKRRMTQIQASIDSYTLARTHYHSLGVLDDDGRVHWPQTTRQ